MSADVGADSRMPVRVGPPPLVVIASSAGGVATLSELFDTLPSDLPIAIAIVQHLDPHRASSLVHILSRHTGMRVTTVEHGDRIEEGTVYVAPPDHHVIVKDDRLELSDEPQVRFSRPSADLLFASAAEHYTAQVIAIVLTGMGSDGSRGLQAIHRAGNVVIAQQPETARSASMPQAAVDTGFVDQIVPLAKIADAIVAIVDSGVHS